MRARLVHKARWIDEWQHTATLVHAQLAQKGVDRTPADLFPFAFPGAERTSAGATYSEIKALHQRQEARRERGETLNVDTSKITTYHPGRDGDDRT